MTARGLNLWRLRNSCGIPDLHMKHGNVVFWPFTVLQSTHRNPMMVPAERQLLDRIRKFKSHPYPA